jgi:hypothetical protein
MICVLSSILMIPTWTVLSILVGLKIVAGAGFLDGNLQGVPEAFHLQSASVR